MLIPIGEFRTTQDQNGPGSKTTPDRNSKGLEQHSSGTTSQQHNVQQLNAQKINKEKGAASSWRCLFDNMPMSTLRTAAVLKAASTVFDRVFPSLCLLCEQPYLNTHEPYVCADCSHALTRNHSACQTCALPLPFIHPLPVNPLPVNPLPSSQHDVLAATHATRGTTRSLVQCGACQSKAGQTNSHPDAICIAAFVYDDLVAHLMHCLKFGRGVREAKFFAGEMAEHVRQAYADYGHHKLPDLLLPVPLSRRNLAKRGYNQAALLASHLSLHLDIAWSSDHLARRHGSPQRQKTRSERLNLPANTFQVTHHIVPPHVALVDDVMTTGRTLQILAQHLHAAGVMRIDLWCAARVL